ncbi:MAG: calcium-translocating P-type ATPase, PMCA-type [Clostridiaceae bacterium]|nr:calcium-translocating P-type ATPase, PMCA-type [Clostridiaceae bacterium]
MTGLASHEAHNRLLKYGKNNIQVKKKVPAVIIFLQQFTDVMTIILMFCTVISAFMGDLIEAVVMIAIVVMNAVLGFVQEYRTERTIEALRNMSAQKATVIRDGTEMQIPAEDIVPGDLVVVSAGDKVPADGRIIDSPGVNVDESMLTGESIAVFKEEGTLYGGTLVTSGHAIMEVTETGMKTEMGKISQMIQDVKEEETPLQRRLASIGKYIVICCIIVCIGVVIVGLFRGQPALEMLLAGISLAVAAVPEGLPAIVTISLALGVQQMAERNALIRKLPAVETLGSTNIICSDKTGTLTQNKMTVRKFVTLGEIISGKSFEVDDKRLFDISRYANNHSDATELALIKATEAHGDDKFERIGEIPFDSARKCMSVIVQDKNGARYIFTKGAPDVVVRKSAFYQENGATRKMSPATQRRIMLYNNQLARDGLRVLAMAWRKLGPDDKPPYEEIEKDLVFLGMAGLIDPPRPEVKDAVVMCQKAGIKTIMITGDHKITASVIAKELDIMQKGDRIITGEELERMSDTELENIVEKTAVFARVLPVHKLRIVKALKKKGHIVAMTGDGVNDAPAVKEADIGIAMGISGTDVTREASAMVLMDDNFATIVSAVRQGRAIYSNIKKFIRYMLSCNLGEVITIFVGIIIGIPLPLLPIQILWVNLVTDGLPGIALGLDPADKDIMDRSPVKAADNIFNLVMLWNIIFRGILTGLCTLGSYLVVYEMTQLVSYARTAAFITLVLIQLVYSFECRSDTKVLGEIDLRENMLLISANAISLLMMLAVVYIPPLQIIFRTVPVSITEWMVILVFTAIGPILGGLLPGHLFARLDKKLKK